jgi:hypothetical protein
VPITAYAPTSAPAQAYRQLAREVLARIDPDSIRPAADPSTADPADDPSDPEQLALG